jgi:cytochrome bd-type quinol oxidase subunit 2
MRGASPLASGVLAVVTLVGAAALAAKALGTSRSYGMLVATTFAVFLGIVMIIVTFAASETVELEAPPAVAGLAPLIAPIVPLALGYLAVRRSRATWRSTYERREGVLFALLAGALLFAALELSPLGAVRVSPPGAAAPTARTPR